MQKDPIKKENDNKKEKRFDLFCVSIKYYFIVYQILILQN